MLYILGYGSVGCLWATHLATLSNEQPSFCSPIFIDGRRAEAGSSDLLFQSNFSDLNGHRFTFDIIPPNKLSLPVDCLLVCTKSFKTTEALKEVSEAILEKTIIVLFQNGLGSQFDVLKLFPNNPIYAAVTTEGANKPSTNNLIHAGKGLTKIGPLNDIAKQSKDRTRIQNEMHLEQLEKYLNIELDEDIWEALWSKLIINCAINPFTALLDCHNGEVRDSSLFKSMWPGLKKELAMLSSLSGYRRSEPNIEKLVFDVMEKTSMNVSSMLQDARKKTRTEIDDINGFASRYLAAANKPNSINKALTENVSMLEKR